MAEAAEAAKPEGVAQRERAHKAGRPEVLVSELKVVQLAEPRREAEPADREGRLEERASARRAQERPVRLPELEAVSAEVWESAHKVAQRVGFSRVARA